MESYGKEGTPLGVPSFCGWGVDGLRRKRPSRLRPLSRPSCPIIALEKRGRGPGGERGVLHQRGRQGPGGGRHGGLRRAVGGLPGGGGPRCPGGTAAGPGARRRADDGTDGPAGHGQRPPGPGRPGGAGTGPRRFGPAPGGETADPAGPGDAGDASGAPAGRRPGPAAPSDALPGGGHGGGPASDHTDGLGGNQRDPVSGTDGGSVPHGAGRGLRGAVGRTGGKGRTTWTSSKGR